MPWSSTYDFLPLAPFRRNIKAVFARDFPAALLGASEQAGWEGEALPALQGMFDARAVRDVYPVANFLTLGSDPTKDEDDDAEERKRLLIEYEDIERDADTLLNRLEIYNLAGRSVVENMTEADLLRLEVAIDGEHRGDFRWTWGTERYGDRQYESENLYVMVGSGVLTLEYLEPRKVEL
jgi:hypothetical protein